MELKPTSPGDFAALRRLFDDPSFHGWGTTGRLSDDLLRAKYLGARSPAVECFLVVSDDLAVGLVQVHTEGGDSAGLDLILLPEARGNGTGRRVVEAMIARARDKGFARLTVDPDVDNEGGTRFWQSVGFEPDPTARPDAGPSASVLMTRDID